MAQGSPARSRTVRAGSTLACGEAVSERGGFTRQPRHEPAGGRLPVRCRSAPALCRVQGPTACTALRPRCHPTARASQLRSVTGSARRAADSVERLVERAPTDTLCTVCFPGIFAGQSVQPVRSGRLSGLLLIRGLGVQVPGGAPVLTWRFYASAAPGRPAAWNESIRWFAAHSALTAHADGPHDHAEQSACMLAMRASPPLARLPRPAAMLTYWPFGVWVERNHNHRAATRTGSDGSAQVTRDRRHRGADDRVVEHAQQHREHDAERVQRTRPGGSVVH